MWSAQGTVNEVSDAMRRGFLSTKVRPHGQETCPSYMGLLVLREAAIRIIQWCVGAALRST
jgi:hypothetical protein